MKTNFSFPLLIGVISNTIINELLTIRTSIVSIINHKLTVSIFTKVTLKIKTFKNQTNAIQVYFSINYG